MNIKYDYNLSAFTNEDDFSYYLLGAFITDGCVYQNNKNNYACQLSSKDKDWLDSIKNIIGNNLKLHKFKENYYGIRVIRNEIAQWLISHGCFPQKTLTVKLPMIPEQYMRDFLRGCIDGDGSIGTYFHKKSSKRTCCLTSSSKDFLLSIQSYLQSKNIKSNISEKKQKEPNSINGKMIIQRNPCYNLYTIGRNAYLLLSLIYYPAHKISLGRKNKLAQDIIYFYENTEVIDKRKIRKLNINCKIQWPEDQILIERINNSNVENVARELGVHGTAIRNRLKTRKLYDQI